ncbi:MAG: hypothetical protein HY079_00120 [Elusimicrobia bacterium]|nr:hypothetical protein [Elusimicrobiota bacterium]
MAASARYPIPAMLELTKGIVTFRRDPRKYFPDDVASRWMLSLLAASHDIGLSQKLVTPFMVAGPLKNQFQRQYRFSHLFYFWRLWLAHVHEAWLMFNKRADHPVVLAIKADPKIRAAFAAVCATRGKKALKDLTAGDLMAKCRNVTFHYDEREGDKWKKQLKMLSHRFPLFITDGDGKQSDTRWLVADEYYLSRLNRLKFSSVRLQKTTSKLTHEILFLVNACQQVYFEQRNPRMRRIRGG